MILEGVHTIELTASESALTVAQENTRLHAGSNVTLVVAHDHLLDVCGPSWLTDEVLYLDLIPYFISDSLKKCSCRY